MSERCGARLADTSMQCTRPPHAPWDHHECGRVEWWDAPADGGPDPFGHLAAAEPTTTFLIGYAWCRYCDREVTTFDHRCTRCFGDLT